MIVPFQPNLAPHFERLNREWLERWFSVEPKDQWYFENPAGTIIEPGGMIFFAIESDAPVGTVAAIRQDAHTFELGKMAVTACCQVRGIGRALAEAVIQHVTKAGASRVVLISDTKLPDAIRLYQRLGFRHTAAPGDTGYSWGDVFMELELPAERADRPPI